MSDEFFEMKDDAVNYHAAIGQTLFYLLEGAQFKRNEGGHTHVVAQAQEGAKKAEEAFTGEEAEKTDLANHVEEGVEHIEEGLGEASEKSGASDRFKHLIEQASILGITADIKLRLAWAGLDSLAQMAPFLGSIVALTKLWSSGTNYLGLKFSEERIKDLSNRVFNSTEDKHTVLFVACVQGLLDGYRQQKIYCKKTFLTDASQVAVVLLDPTGIAQKITGPAAAVASAFFQIERLIAIHTEVNETNQALENAKSFEKEKRNFSQFQLMLVESPLIGTYLLPPSIHVKNFPAVYAGSGRSENETVLDFFVQMGKILGAIATLIEGAYDAVKGWFVDWLTQAGTDVLVHACHATLCGSIKNSNGSLKIDTAAARAELLTGMMLGIAPKDLYRPDLKFIASTKLEENQKKRLVWFNETCERADRFKNELGFDLVFEEEKILKLINNTREPSSNSSNNMRVAPPYTGSGTTSRGRPVR